MTVIGEAYIQIKGQVEGDAGINKLEGEIEGVGGTAEKSSGRARAAFSKIGSVLGQAFGPAFEPIQNIMDQFGELDLHAGKLKDNIGKYALGIGGAMTTAGVAITTMSDKDKVSTQQLEQAVKNAGGSWDKYKDKTEETIHTQEGFGHTAVETQDALTDLVTRTHNVNGSYENMQLVADLAAQKHISLASAASLVGRVMNGQTRTLKLYGISQDQLNKAMDKGHYHEVSQKYDLLQSSIAADKSKSSTLSLRDAKIRDQLASTTNKAEQAKLNDELKRDTLTRAELSHRISDNTAKSKDLKTQMTDMQKGAAAGRAGIELLAQKLHGQAAIAANTFSGRMAAVKARIEDFANSVGQKVGPVLTTAGPILMGFGAIIETGVVGKLGKAAKAAVAFMKPAQLAATATKVWTGIQAAFNVVMDANPIILVSAAVIALGAAVYLAYTHFKPFRDLVNTVGRALKDAFLTAIQAVVQAFHWFVGAVETAWNFIYNIFKKYGTILLAVVAPVVGIPLLIMQHWKTIKNFFVNLWDGVVDFFKKLPGRIVGAIGDLGRFVWNAIKGGLNAMKGLFGKWIDLNVELTGKLPMRAIKAIGNLGMQIWQHINDGLATMKSKIMDFIGGVVNFFQTFPTKVMRAIGNLGAQIWGGIDNGLANMKDKILNWVSNVANWFGSIGGKAVRAVGNIGSEIWSKISGGLNTAKDHISSWISSAAHVFTSFAGKAKSAFSGATSWLYQAGKDVISGLVNGIKAAISSAVDAVKNAASSVVNGAKHLLHIGSPSRVFHEIGENIMHGMANGIESKIQHLQGTMSHVNAEMMREQSRLKFVMPGNAAGIPMAYAGGGGDRVYNLFPNANINMGDEHPAQLVRRLEAAIRVSRL